MLPQLLMVLLLQERLFLLLRSLRHPSVAAARAAGRCSSRGPFVTMLRGPCGPLGLLGPLEPRGPWGPRVFGGPLVQQQRMKGACCCRCLLLLAAPLHLLPLLQQQGPWGGPLCAAACGGWQRIRARW